ncbi:MAG TPA: hypothetical protein PLB31_02485 [Fimbriimonadaceae bacterium]|nr:hypothetical protein [Armatimonadota bacterium]HCM73047.1 hypothetical protein [Armatimonadota bacterium]HRI73317.1 hypothetical protein [Fimbriimonadaceae bacterium]
MSAKPTARRAAPRKGKKAARKPLQMGHALLILSGFAFAFAAYFGFSQYQASQNMAQQIESELGTLRTAQADAEAMDVEGKYHRIVGDRIVKEFNGQLSTLAVNHSVQIVRGGQDDQLDPRITRASGKGPAEGWANLTYEFEIVGDTRNVHQLLRTLAEGPMAFEFEDITYRRRSADPLQKGINARVSVRLVTRQGLAKGPAGPVNPAATPPTGGKA